jgi:uncharacterized protein YjbJ (UPF0337 family)
MSSVEPEHGTASTSYTQGEFGTMVTRQELEGKWNEVKGRLQDRWGQLTDDELQRGRGSANELVGVVQQKTGESRREIEAFLDEVIAEGGSMVGAAKEAAQEYAHQASEAMHAGYDQVAQTVVSGYEQAENAVRRHPAESVAVALGAGIITGVVLGLLMKSR